MHFFTLLKQGQHYLNTWPLDDKLAMIFPENRIIKATVFAQKFMPFMAVFTIVWQQIYAKGDNVAFAIALLTAIFAIGIPLQGLYWLGKRADTPLPAQTLYWFIRIDEELKKIFKNPPCFDVKSANINNEKITYRQLAERLTLAKKYLPNEFWQEL